ncbi:MAG: hypothetical protein RR581_06395 [Eubacterium sp.]
MDEKKTNINQILRSELYERVWEISLAKVAELYAIPYSRLYKLCKDNDIPIPPSGYWTKLTFGKSVEKTPLLKSEVEIINLCPMRENKKSGLEKKQAEQPRNPKSVDKPETKDVLENVAVEPPYQRKESVETYNWNGKTYNKYDRETLYSEVWEKPVTEVSRKYGVSDVAIHNICKSLNVPVPPRGYWAKLRANKKVKKTELPKQSKWTKISGERTEVNPTVQIGSEALTFLTDEERNMILEISRQIQMPDERELIPAEILEYKKKVNEWNKNDRKETYAQRSPNSYIYYGSGKKRPFMAGVISRESLSRAYRIIGALYNALLPLGCSITPDIEFVIRNENVTIELYERQSKEEHKLSIQEERELRKYEQEKKVYQYASKPNIRKYDYVFNGNLTLRISGGCFFRDISSRKLEG